MKFIRNKYSLLFLILFILIIIDLILGKINETDVIRKSSLNFRNEAKNLELKTRYLIPNVSHRYQKSFTETIMQKLEVLELIKTVLLLVTRRLIKKVSKFYF